MQNVGIIGLGRMGVAIAQRMSDSGHSVLGWTRSGRDVDGVDCVDDLADLVAKSDSLVLSLFDDKAVGDVLDALLQCDLTGKQIIETSTVVPDLIKARIDQINAAGATAVDAPISGGPELVLAGQCGVFIGGDDAAATRATETLAAISQRIFHVGPLGAGLAMKAINNGMLQTYFNGLMDLMPMAQRAGLPLETILRILCGGPAGVPMVRDRIEKVLGEDQTVGFTVSAALKDVDVFQRIVQSFGLHSPMLEEFAQHSVAAVDAGLGESDPALMIRRAYDNGAP